MATTIEQLIVRIGADLRGLNKGLAKAEHNILRSSSKIRDAGTSLSLSVSLPLAAAGLAASKFSGSFEKAMAKSTAIMGQQGVALRAELDKTARAVATDVPFSATQAADAYFFLASAGLTAKDSIAALPAVAKFAVAGQFDLARATDLATDAQSALGLTIRGNSEKNLKNLVRVQDDLVKANTLANASVEQFSESLQNKAGASLRQVNKDIEEGLAVLAAFADQGTKGAEAGTRFAIVMRDLQTKAIRNREAFAEMGIEVFDAAGDMRNLADVIGNIEVALGGMSDEQRKATLLMLGFSDKSVAALQALLGTSEQIRKYEKELRKAGGTTDEVAKQQLNNFVDQMRLIEQRIADVAITVGNTLNPVLSELANDIILPLLDGVERVTEKFAELDPWVQKIVVVVGLAVVALGPLLIAIGLVGAGVGGLIGLLPSLTSLFAGFGSVLSVPVIGALGLVGSLLVASVAVWKTWGDDITDIWNDVQASLKLGPRKFREGTQEYRDYARKIKEDFDRELRTGDGTSALGSNVDKFLGGFDRAPRDTGSVEGFKALQNPPIPQLPKLDLFGSVNALAGGAAGAINSITDQTRAMLENSGAAQRMVAVNESVSATYDQLATDLAFISAKEEVFGVSLETNMERSRAAEEAIVSLIEQGFDPASERIQQLSQDLIDNRDAWQVWAADVIDIGLQVSNAMFEAFESLVQGISTAVAQAIVFEQDFAATSLNILKRVAVQIIAQLIQIAVNSLIQAIVRSTAAATQASAEIASSAGSAAAFAAADFIKDTGWLGVFGAAAIGTLASLAVTGSAAAAIAAGKGVGATVALGSGGIVTGPVGALLGEGGENEVVFPLSDLRRFIGDVRGDGGARGGIQVFIGAEEVRDIVMRGVVDDMRDQGAG